MVCIALHTCQYLHQYLHVCTHTYGTGMKRMSDNIAPSPLRRSADNLPYHIYSPRQAKLNGRSTGNSNPTPPQNGSDHPINDSLAFPLRMSTTAPGTSVHRVEIEHVPGDETSRQQEQGERKSSLGQVSAGSDGTSKQSTSSMTFQNSASGDLV